MKLFIYDSTVNPSLHPPPQKKKKAKLLSGYCVMSDIFSRLSATSKSLSFRMCLEYKQTKKKEFFFQLSLPFSLIFMYLQLFKTSQGNFCYQKGIMIVS